MDEDLLHDLSKYKSYRDKSVSASARSLIQLFREKNPHLLERKDRGKPTEFQRDLIPLAYGQANPKSYLEGAELLQENDKEQEKQSDNDDDDDDEEEDNEEEGWVNVSHSDDDDDEDLEEEVKEEEENGDDQQENENKVKSHT
jgi:protein SDA1